ncbi:hypothetical protein DICPUDRAFT_159919 [Dictyostelium purpureum]|uniref:SET domain-containing protein n=1 Tax=Dictyostelium purpureum TaxID=5786 RepID=F1A5A3_DICPU|nr:uncharacterized protein DICPUDRAFT_159919 [Dictyostelium purpureum]EGC28624.1 hypothetical protein DICPUDRAFT_159919 [Dictyostelium purpureum]|eukprot:XP_003294847.1 hypothetical protein DICPUDRAFT_159919 [Dictyostelium purpureum]
MNKGETSEIIDEKKSTNLNGNEEEEEQQQQQEKKVRLNKANLKKSKKPKKPKRVQLPIDYKLWHTEWPIEVYKHPVNGRYLVATKDIEEQTVILRDLPYTWAVDHAACDIVCQHCFLEVPLNQQILPTDFYMCEGCNRVGYCSIHCKYIDYNQHRFECQIFKELDTEEYSPFLLSEIKLLVRTLSRKWLEESINSSAGVDESEISKINTYNQYKNPSSLIPQDNGLRYNDYADLVSNVENYNESLKESLSYWICKYIVKLAAKIDKEEDEDELLNILLRNRCNAFYIQGRPRDGTSGESRGCGVYVRNSFFNHSCDPNVNYWVVNNTLEVECTLLKNVKEGEELTISYIDTSAPLNKRREKLLEGYLFTCLCTKCKADELLPLDQTGTKDDDESDSNINTNNIDIELKEEGVHEISDKDEELEDLVEE